MDKSVACVCLQGSGIILMAELSHKLTGNKNNTAKFTGRGEPETAKVCGELGCREMEWEGLSPKLKCITACREQCQVVREVRTTLAGGEFLLSGLSVVQAQGTAVSAHPFPHQNTKSTSQSGHIKFIPGILVIHWHCKCYRSY